MQYNLFNFIQLFNPLFFLIHFKHEKIIYRSNGCCGGHDYKWL